MLLQIFCLPPAEASPIDFEAMAAEQNHCQETQRLLSGSFLTVTFHQAGAQRLVGDVSTGVFQPVVPEKF
jgi:hypothetical protein